MEPTYQHDCEACIFMGTWTGPDQALGQENALFDLYVCPRETTLGTCCIARFGNDGPEYASMSLTAELWDASLAAIHGARQSMYHCYIPALCEVWRRWKEKQEAS